MTEVKFKNRKLNIGKLLSFGFEAVESGYVYHADLAWGQLKLTVKIDAGKMYAEVIDHNMVLPLSASAAPTDA